MFTFYQNQAGLDFLDEQDDAGSSPKVWEREKPGGRTLLMREQNAALTAVPLFKGEGAEGARGIRWSACVHVRIERAS